MRRWAQQTYPRVDVDSETAKFVLHHQGEGTRRHNWYATWQKWITSANQYLNKHGTHSNVVALHAATQHRDGTDARVAGWGALAAQLDSQGDPS